MHQEGSSSKGPEFQTHAPGPEAGVQGCGLDQGLRTTWSSMRSPPAPILQVQKLRPRMGTILPTVSVSPSQD